MQNPNKNGFRIVSLVTMLCFTTQTLALPLLFSKTVEASDYTVALESAPEYLNPLDYGLPEYAVEMPEKRTLRSVTFNLGGLKRASVSVSSDLFTTDSYGNIVLASDKGVLGNDFYAFENLPQNTQVAFHLDRPAYTYTKDGHSFTMSLEGYGNPTIQENVVTYQLDNAQLRFTVEGQRVIKDILVDKQVAGVNPEFPFQLTSETLTQTLNEDHEVVFTDEQGEEVITLSEPVIETMEGEYIAHDITLEVLDGDLYSYVYNDAGLPDQYIVDPDTGAVGAGAGESSSSNGGSVAWLNPGNVTANDDSVASFNSASSTNVSEMLKVYNFVFSIPSGAIIDGVEVSIDGSNTFNSSAQTAGITLLDGSRTPTGNAKDAAGAWASNPTVFGNSSDTWGASLTDTIVNDSDFGIGFYAQDQFGFGTSVSIDHVTMTVYYTGGGADDGDVCSVNGDCTSSNCEDGICRPWGDANCSALSLPSGVTMHLESDDSQVTTANLSSKAASDVEVYLQEDSERLASMKVRYLLAGITCQFATGDVDTTNKASVVHDLTSNFLLTDAAYTLHVLKDASHNQIRVCSGKTSQGCTSSDSWSFVANSSGTITETNGGFDTTGITVSQNGTYWSITGLTSTSGQGEGGVVSVNEFSLWALILMLGAVTYVMQKNEGSFSRLPLDKESV